MNDGSVAKSGIGATLYVNRDSKVQLAGFFSAKLRKHQVAWLPCQIEALSIAASIKHFSPYITHLVQPTCLLTESKPCVQAVQKLCRGEFSASPRVTSFLCQWLCRSRSTPCWVVQYPFRFLKPQRCRMFRATLPSLHIHRSD